MNMGKKPTKAANNVYCITRLEAASSNELLSSREGAAEITGIDRTRIANIELGNIVPYPEEVQLMSDAYNAPELLHWHCLHNCPIGKHTVTQVEVKEIFQLTVQLCNTLKDAPFAKEELLDIVADGHITCDEKPRMEEIIKVLDDIGKQAASLKLWVQKNI